MALNWIRQPKAGWLAFAVALVFFAVVAALAPQSAMAIGGTISGTVYEPGGVGADGVWVYAYSGFNSYSTTTGFDGSYTIPGVSDGSYAISCDPWSYNMWHDPDLMGVTYPGAVTVSGGVGQSGVDMTMVGPGSISGTVYGPDGTTGVGGILVSVFGPSFKSTYTNPDGTYTVTGLSSGSYFWMQFNTTQYNQLNDPDLMPGSLSGQWIVTNGVDIDVEDVTLHAFGTISGTVYGPDATTKLAGVRVSVDTSGGTRPLTSVDGTYTVGGLYEGYYSLIADPAQYNLTHEPDLGKALLEDVWTAPDTETTGADFILQPAGGISGTVYGPGGVGVEGIVVHIEGSIESTTTTTTVGGAYAVNGLAADEYAVSFATEHYNGETDPDLAPADYPSPVTIAPGFVTENIDITLELAGWITGTVSGPDGPLAGIDLYVFQGSIESSSTTVTTGIDGTYLIPGLAGGSYRVVCDTQRYNWSHPAEPGFAEAMYPDVVTVAHGLETSGIDFVLGERGSISGRVVGPDGVTGVGNVSMYLSGMGGGFCYTSADGTYSFNGVAPGFYSVSASCWQYNVDHDPDLAPVPSWQSVSLMSGTDAMGVDFSLQQIGRISGHVYESDGATPIAGATVWVRDDVSGRSINTNGDGSYTCPSAPGTYEVSFSAPGNWATEYYNNVHDYAAATPISVDPGATVANIDASLEQGAMLSGQVTGDGSVGLEGIMVTAWDEATGSEETTSTGVDGTWQLHGMNAGSYVLSFDPTSRNAEFDENYARQEWNSGTPLVVNLGDTVGDLNVQLAQNGLRLSVAIDAPGVDVSGFFVSLWQRRADGTYVWLEDQFDVVEFRGLAPGDYYLAAEAWGEDYDVLWAYDSRPLGWDSYFSHDFPIADPVTLVDSDISITMTPPAATSVSGIAVDPAGLGQSVAMEYWLDCGAEGWKLAETTMSDGRGFYSTTLGAGNYKIRFIDESGVFDEVWYGGGSSLADAQQLTLTGGDLMLDAQVLPHSGAPSAPTGLLAAASGPGSIDLDWTAASDTFGIGSYLIYEEGGTQVGESTETSFTVNGLLPGTSYTYYVVAVDRAGNPSGSSATASATTDADTVDPVTTILVNPAFSDGPGGWYVTAPLITLWANEPGASTYYYWGTGSPQLYGGPITAPQGENTLTYYSIDLGNNREGDRTRAFKVDSIAPAIVVTGVTDGGSYASPGATPVVTIDGMTPSAFVAAGGSCTITLDTNPFTSGTLVSGTGSHTLVVDATDAVGNDAIQTSIAFDVDTSTPVIGISGVTDGTTYPASGATPVITIDGMTPTEWVAAGGSVTATLDSNPFTSGTTVTASGAHTLVVDATDAAGNPAIQASMSFTIDAVAPVIVVSGVTDGSSYTEPGATPVITIDGMTPSAFVAASGSLTVTLDTNPFTSGTLVIAEGLHTLVVDATDAAGNDAVQTVIQFTIDTIPPSTDFTGVIGGFTYPATGCTPVITVDGMTPAAFIASGGTYAATLDGSPYTSGTPVTSNGAHTLVVDVEDAATNPSQASVSFAVDAVLPAIVVSGVDDGGSYASPGATPVITIDGMTPSAFVAAGGSCTITLDANPFTSGTLVTGEGSHTLVVDATDAAGNDAIQTSISFDVDTVAPVIGISGVTGSTTYPATGATPAITIDGMTASAWVAAGGSVTATLDSSPFTSGTTVTGNGSHTLVVDAADAAGNPATQASVTFSVDAVAPAIVVSGVTNDGVYPAPAGVTPVFTIDGMTPSAFIAAGGSSSATLNSAPFTSGTGVATAGSYTLVISADDAAGNHSVTTITFVLDRLPVITPIPDQPAEEGMLLSFKVTATDADADPLTFSLVNPPSGAAITTDGDFTWTPSEDQGSSSPVLTVRVSDGKLTADAQFTVNIAEVNVAPVLNYIGNKTVKKGSTLTFQASATDADVPANTLTFSLAGAPAGAVIPGGAFSWTPSAVGSYSFTVIVSDGQGGTDSEPITVTVSEAAPAVVNIPVYRFYRASTGTHFYTADENEMIRVRDTMQSTYSLDGVGYYINAANAANSVPLYRFYNKRTGTHLYTADANEAANIQANLSGTYSLDGVAYNVSMSGGQAVHRFYSPSKGVHFYSADPNEIANVKANLANVWQYEGPAYYVGQ